MMKRTTKMKMITAITVVSMMTTMIPVYDCPVDAAAKPGKVKKITKVKITDHSLKIKIKKVKRAKGYQIRLYKGNKSKALKQIKVKKAVVTLSGLTADTTYTIRVRAYTKSGKKYVYGKEKVLTCKTATKKTLPVSQSQTPAPTTSVTATPSPTEVPIVQKAGNVEDSDYQRAVAAFEPAVKKMRQDGVVKSDDVCVVMDAACIKVDITIGDSETDLQLCKNTSTNQYTLTFDYDFTWIEGLGQKVNGKDPALYNKDLLMAILSMVSNDPQALFDRIDMDCYSCGSLSDTEWEKIGDCLIMSGGMEIGKYISYKIAKEPSDVG